MLIVANQIVSNSTLVIWFQMKAEGICGTDLHLIHDKIFEIPAGTILGHEASGVVHEVGQ